MTALSTSTKLAGVARLWLLNFLGNAAALTVIYGWLLIPDAHGWQVAASALIALAGVFLMAWLRAGTFAYFRVSEFRERADLWPAFRRGLRHLIPLIVCAAVFFALAWWLWSLREYTPQFGVWLRQKLNARSAAAQRYARCELADRADYFCPAASGLAPRRQHDCRLGPSPCEHWA